ncbi:MAG TPA: hypothetical protein VEH77_07345, partial [Roseiarcus sp.]|nr:hypothetical protein [Roseiarcus sp.]
MRVGKRVLDAVAREAWDEFEQLFAPEVFVESRRKIVGFTQIELKSPEWRQENRRILETGGIRPSQVVMAVRGERLALARLVLGTADVSPGAPRDELLQLYGIDEEGRIALHVFFDVDDLDAALAELDAAHARSEAVRPQARRLENAASRVFERVLSHLAARNWDVVADTVADSYSAIDHRRVVNAGIQHGRDALIKDVQAAADLGLKMSMLSVIAIRGERLVLARIRASGPDAETIRDDVLNVVEIDADERIAAVAVFDLDDFDAAIAELDARYLAGEALAHGRTWSVIARASWSLIRHELPPTTPDWVNLDHRRGIAVGPGDMTAYIRAVWDVEQSLSAYIETVHRLNNIGAVFVQVLKGTSQEGFDAEWRIVELMTVEGDLISRGEIFDEADIDAALARFDQLNQPAPQLGNAASQALERYMAHFASRDWDALANVLADDISTDDRRRVVNAGIRHGRDAEIANLRAIADTGLGTYMTSVVIAARGERLILARVSSREQGPERFITDVLGVVEVSSHSQIAAIVVFDIGDFNDAIAELDARYLAGEAAAHKQIWSVVGKAYAALNRRELPPTMSDWVTIDHRVRATFEGGDLTAYIRAAWDLTPDLNIYIEAVQRLSNLGAVVTHAAYGTSREGFDAEWRMIELLTVGGDQIDRCEIFD